MHRVYAAALMTAAALSLIAGNPAGLEPTRAAIRSDDIEFHVRGAPHFSRGHRGNQRRIRKRRRQYAAMHH